MIKRKSPLTRGDFPQGIPSGRGVSIGFYNNLMNIPVIPLFSQRDPSRGKGDFDDYDIAIELRFITDATQVLVQNSGRVSIPGRSISKATQ